MPSNIEIQSKDNSVSISTTFFNSRPIFALLDFTMPTLHKQYLAAERQVDNRTSRMEMLRFSCKMMNLENVLKLDSILCSFPLTLLVFLL